MNKPVILLLLLFFAFLGYRYFPAAPAPEPELTFEGAYKYICQGTGGIWAYPCPSCAAGAQCKPCGSPCDCGAGKEFDYQKGCIVAAALAPLQEPPLPPDEDANADSECAVGGCYGTFCADRRTVERVSPTCAAELPEYACYKRISCVRIAGKCAWQVTPDFEACIARARGAEVDSLPPLPE